MNVKTIVAVSTLAVLAVAGSLSTAYAQQAGGTIAIQGRAHGERHPELRRAMNQLMRVKTSLQNANRDFGGHRAKAADLVQQAIEEVRQAIKADKN